MVLVSLLGESLHLLGALATVQVADPVLGVELHGDLATEAGGAAVQGASLDDGGLGHDIELRVQAGATVATEEVLVVLARVTGDVVGLGSAFYDSRESDQSLPFLKTISQRNS